MAQKEKRLFARDYRHLAIDIVKPVQGSFALTYLVYVVIMVVAVLLVNIPYMAANNLATNVISSLLTVALLIFTSGAFTFSLILMNKKAHDKKQGPEVVDIFVGFKQYGKSLALFVLNTIFVALWTLLLIIPGIIKLFSYALSFYIALDNPKKSSLDCITESRKLMKGHKWQLFCLGFSYIGWFILVVLTLGILGLWVVPKFNQAKYEFYLKIKK